MSNFSRRSLKKVFFLTEREKCVMSGQYLLIFNPIFPSYLLNHVLVHLLLNKRSLEEKRIYKRMKTFMILNPHIIAIFLPARLRFIKTLMLEFVTELVEFLHF